MGRARRASWPRKGRGVLGTRGDIRRGWVGRGLRVGSAAALVSASFVALAPAAHADDFPVAFTTAGCTTWTAPDGIGAVSVVATGAAGTTGVGTPDKHSAGGLGDEVAGTLTGLSGGDKLYICVDVGGGPSGGGGSGDGGGASGVSFGTDFSQPVVVAGGGGGGATQVTGGGAGFPIAQNGENSFVTVQPGGGGGGGNSATHQPGAGGAAGSGFNGSCGVDGTSGTAYSSSGPGAGGTGGLTDPCGALYRGGGGGGAGLYGGGGGGSGLNGGAGGGGSDGCAASSCTVMPGAGTQTTAGAGAGNAQVRLMFAASALTDLFDASTNAPSLGDLVTGARVYDTAIVGPLSSTPEIPSGSVTYGFFTNGSCAGVPGSTSTAAVNFFSAGPSATTAALAPGEYSFDAVYSGDASFGPTTSSCEPFTVSPATPTVSSQVYDARTSAAWSGSEKSGAQAFDTASFGGVSADIPPQGTVTYSLYADPSCAASPISQEEVTLNADGSIPSSSSSAPLPPGSYGYSVQYSGDVNYASAVTPACESFTVAGPAKRPKVTGVSPASGSVSGGTAITITGSGFVRGATVVIGQGHGVGAGAIAATNVQVVSPTEVTAVTGGGAHSGKWHVFVTTVGGTSPGVAASAFTYVPGPMITSVSPSSGPASGGTLITIEGVGFGSTPGSVAIGQGHWSTGAIPADVQTWSPTEITAITGGGARPGRYNVFVTVGGYDTSRPVPGDVFKYLR